MIEVYKNLWVGSDQDFEKVQDAPSWAFVQAAREPWHRQALAYTGRNALSNDPECLIACRINRLILNMIDADSHESFRSVMFYEACDFIEAQLFNDERKLLVHSKLGKSRGPSVALIYLTFRVKLLPATSFGEAMAEFMKLYPDYTPGKGIQEFLERVWDSGLFE